MLDGRGETARFEQEMAAQDPEFAAFLASKPSDERVVAPEIEAHVAHIWQAWTDLKSDRHADGFGNIGPIFYDTISAYARDHGICGEEFLIFKRLIKAMDDEYLAFERKRQKGKDQPT